MLLATKTARGTFFFYRLTTCHHIANDYTLFIITTQHTHTYYGDVRPKHMPLIGLKVAKLY